MLVLLALSSALGMGWAVHYQRRVLRAITVHRRVVDAELVGAAAPAARAAATRLAAPHGAWATSWTDSCRVTGAMALGGTALIAARHCDADDDFTLVLLIGNDRRAAALMALLDRWTREGVAVRLHPAAVAGTVELVDEWDNAIRATLLAS